MAFSATYTSNTYTAGSGATRYVKLYVASTDNVTGSGGGTSKVTWKAYFGGKNSSTTTWINCLGIQVKINGTTVLNRTESFKTYVGDNATVAGSGTTSAISHSSDGTKSINVSVTAHIYSSGQTSSISETFVLRPNPVYSLSMTPGANSTISVSRTYSANGGNTGSISAGSNILCKNDTLKITFTPNANFQILTSTVNNNPFTSGNTYTVSGNVAVASTTQALSSSVAVADANIGGSTTITVNKSNPEYYHELYFSFPTEEEEGNRITGYVNSDGGYQNSAVRISASVIGFQIPSTFSSKLASRTYGTMSMTCKTYSASSGGSQIGDTRSATCRISVPQDVYAPDVSGTVVDANPTTVAATGDSSKLVQLCSQALCTITATAKEGATIVTKTINGSTIQGSENTYIIPANRLDNKPIVFSATDSRGYTSTYTVTPTIIPYGPVTINPFAFRPSPTTGEVSAKFNGVYYQLAGQLSGGTSNTITVTYQYRPINEQAFSNAITVSPGDIRVLSTSSYASGTDGNESIPLEDVDSSTTGFDYDKTYEFKFNVSDRLGSTASTSVYVQRGKPVFNWGENDFEFGVPVNVNGSISFADGFARDTLHNLSNAIYFDVEPGTGARTFDVEGSNGVYMIIGTTTGNDSTDRAACVWLVGGDSSPTASTQRQFAIELKSSSNVTVSVSYPTVSISHTYLYSARFVVLRLY